MAIDINGYNDTFRAFVDFAKGSKDIGEKKAIARVSTGISVAGGALAGRTILATKTDSVAKAGPGVQGLGPVSRDAVAL
jgi:hypothetical protein